MAMRWMVATTTALLVVLLMTGCSSSSSDFDPGRQQFNGQLRQDASSGVWYINVAGRSLTPVSGAAIPVDLLVAETPVTGHFGIVDPADVPPATTVIGEPVNLVDIQFWRTLASKRQPAPLADG